MLKSLNLNLEEYYIFHYTKIFLLISNIKNSNHITSQGMK